MLGIADVVVVEGEESDERGVGKLFQVFSRKTNSYLTHLLSDS